MYGGGPCDFAEICVVIGNLIFENVSKNGIIFLKVMYNSNSYFVWEHMS